MLRHEIPYNMRVKRILPGLALAALFGCGGGGGGSTGSTPDPTPSQAKWTVLVYMNAANDLSTYSDANVNQMERLASNPDVRFVVQWKKAKGWWDTAPLFQGTRRYLIGHDTSDAIKSTLVQDMGDDVDMGKASTLADFVEWGKRTYPADHTMVIVWDHGTGWQRLSTLPRSRSISADYQTGTRLQAWDLANGFPSKVDVISTDACLMQMVEVAYQLRAKCDYFVASEDLVPAEGYAYDKVFAGMDSRADASVESTMGDFAATYAALPYSPYSDWNMQQSVVATAKLPALATALDTLAGAMIDNKDALAAIAPDVREKTRAYDASSVRTYLDLVDLASRLAASNAPATVKTAASSVVQATKAAVVANSVNALGTGGNGITVDFSPSAQFKDSSLATDYANLDFAKDTRWEEWLKVAP
ncbi:N/A [soil metagenome]